MNIVTTPQQLAAKCTAGSIVTLGNFDGVHLGHQTLIKRVTALAAEQGLPSVVVTFDPHPLQVLLEQNAPPSLMPLITKLDCLQSLGVDYVLVLPFTRQQADQAPEDFVREVLINALHVKHVVIGYDYTFGKQRRGNAVLLGDFGKEYGFVLEQMPPLHVHDAIVSSTLIREKLREGDVREAAEFLGRPHCVLGKVVHGRKRGGQLGFPTANLEPDANFMLPKRGIYAVFIERLTAGTIQYCACLPDPVIMLRGVANIGVNPTFGNEGLHTEVHLFDFCSDLYGEYLRVHFIEYLREERRFSDISALREQINLDVQRGKEVLQACCDARCELLERK